MSDERPRATLSDKQARGGVIGGKGYGFQAAYIVSRIPLWLADADFAQFLQEGAGDVDVRFNRADGEERRYIQVKNYEVKPAKAREVFAEFRDTDAGSPGTYTLFTLACPGLHTDLKRLRAAVEELRGAAPFYRPGQDPILDNTWADLESMVEKLELPVDAAFLVDKVDFDTDLAGLTDDASLCNLFVGSLLRVETWARVPPEGAVRAYQRLALLCHQAIRQTCSREQIEAFTHEAIGELPTEAEAGPAAGEVHAAPHPQEDWGQAIDVSVFYGRKRELAKLNRWVVDDNCRLVATLGIGGIGKSSLVKKVAEQIREQFDYLFWRDLRNAPPLDDVLGDCIKFLSDQLETGLPESLDSKILLLIEYLRKHRCLLVLDNVEAILRKGDRAGHYREGYEGYGLLIQRVGETDHQSCLVLTSREKPREIALLEGRTSPVRSLQLGGLGQRDGRKILRDKGLRGTKEVLARLIDHYAGNPLALRIVASTIQKLYGGGTAQFLDRGAMAFGDIWDVLDEQFDRLSELERDLMFWLAIEREAVPLESLLGNIVRSMSQRELQESLESLQDRSLLRQVLHFSRCNLWS